MTSLFEFINNNPWFFAVAIPAVFLIGLSKGGLGGGLAGIGTPMIALVIPPVMAAAIILPVLLVGDAVGIYNYRKHVKWSVFSTIIPAATIGILIGALTVSYVSDDAVRIALGLISIIFSVVQFLKDYFKHPAQKENKFKGYFWGVIAGITSFISHSGGPPYQAYTLGLKLDKVLYAGTTAVSFATINAIKLVPYFALGQFNTNNLWISASLVPVAVAGALSGVWIVKRVSQALFYNFTYAFMIIIGFKLLWDGRGAFLPLIEVFI